MIVFLRLAMFYFDGVIKVMNCEEFSLVQQVGLIYIEETIIKGR